MLICSLASLCCCRLSVLGRWFSAFGACDNTFYVEEAKCTLISQIKLNKLSRILINSSKCFKWTEQYELYSQWDCYRLETVWIGLKCIMCIRLLSLDSKIPLTELYFMWLCPFVYRIHSNERWTCECIHSPAMTHNEQIRFQYRSMS